MVLDLESIEVYPMQQQFQQQFQSLATPGLIPSFRREYGM